jgi:hypothetical protein
MLGHEEPSTPSIETCSGEEMYYRRRSRNEKNQR